MARNIKGEDKKISMAKMIRLCPTTKKIWELQVKQQNMSKWIRRQIIFHYGTTLSEHERKEAMREEIAIENRNYDTMVKVLEERHRDAIATIQGRYI